jgi:hypothetical protein
MGADIDDLVHWCEAQRQSSLRQIALFGTEGVKAFLQMPDGSTQDITAGVVKHQTEMVDRFGALIEALKR